MLTLNIKPYCNCIERGVWHRQDGYALDLPSGLWVCGRCHKPSKMNYERGLRGGLPIPQPRKEIDIYDQERKHDLTKMARQVITLELDWGNDEDDLD